MRSTFARLQQAIGVLLLCFGLNVQAQMKVGQPSGSPDPSSALDVSGGPYSNGSPYRGIAPPKVALTQTASAGPITNPATGLLIYNTAKTGDVTPGYYYWEGSKWARFSTTSSVGSARVEAVDGQHIPAYLITQVTSLTANPDIIYIADQGREGMFRYVSGSTLTSDGAIILTATSGRYLRVIPDGRITPQMFGAKGDGVTNDGAALLAWINYSGSYEHYLPAGYYLSNVALERINKKSFTLKGAGMNKTEIRFTNDTDGLIIRNIDKGLTPEQDTTYGSISVRDIKVSSTGIKSAGRIGLGITNQHLQRPGPTVERVAVWAQTIGQEWTKAIEFYECSETFASSIDIQSPGSSSITTGVSYSTASGLPAVEHSLSRFNIRSGKTGIEIVSPGAPGIEGVVISDGTIVSSRYGIVAKSINPSYGAPVLNITDVHANVSGGEALHTENIQQIHLSGNVFYINDGYGGSAVRGMYFDNPVILSGDVTVLGLSNTLSNLVQFDNTSAVAGLVKLDLHYNIKGNNTNVVYAAAGYNGLKIGCNGLFNGIGPWNGTVFAGPGAPNIEFMPTVSGDLSVVGLVPVSQLSVNPLRLTTPRKAFPDKAIGISASTTIDASIYGRVSVYNPGPSAVTVSIDETNLIEETNLIINRAFGCTGPIIIKFVNTTANKIEDENLVPVDTYKLGTGASSQVVFRIANGQLVVISSSKGVVHQNEAFNTGLITGTPLVIRGTDLGQKIVSYQNSSNAVVGTIGQDGTGSFVHLDATVSGSPTAVITLGAGMGASVVVRNGDGDSSHQLSITWGPGSSVGFVFTVTFAKPYKRVPNVTIVRVGGPPATINPASVSTIGYIGYAEQVNTSGTTNYVVTVSQ